MKSEASGVGAVIAGELGGAAVLLVVDVGADSGAGDCCFPSPLHDAAKENSRKASANEMVLPVPMHCCPAGWSLRCWTQLVSHAMVRASSPAETITSQEELRCSCSCWDWGRG